MSQSLRAVSPKLYRYITDKMLDLYHIHSYDFQANAIKKETGLQVILRFGENFTQKEEQFFTFTEIEEESKKIAEFVKKTGEICEDVMVKDYFKIMKP